MRWVLSCPKSSAALGFALGPACPSVGLEDARLVVLLAESGSGQVGHEAGQTFVMKPQIAVIEPCVGLQ